MTRARQRRSSEAENKCGTHHQAAAVGETLANVDDSDKPPDAKTTGKVALAAPRGAEGRTHGASGRLGLPPAEKPHTAVQCSQLAVWKSGATGPAR